MPERQFEYEFTVSITDTVWAFSEEEAKEKLFDSLLTKQGVDDYEILKVKRLGD